MKILLFGATGMVGQGVLRECLLDPGVESVISIVRKPSGKQDPKLRELVLANFYDLTPLQNELTGIDACFYCLGTSSTGISERKYRRISYDMTMEAAGFLVRLNPDMTFIYVSATGADPSERGRIMWARIRGAVENALLRLPFRQIYIFRPALVQPLNGITSRTRGYRIAYTFLAPVLPILVRAFPRYATTTEQIGKAMLAVTRNGYPTPILESRDINSGRKF